MPRRMLPKRTIVCVLLAWLFCFAPMYCETMLAPDCENAWSAVKRAPRMGSMAPTPAAAVSEVRDKNQLSIMGWIMLTANVRISGHERLMSERSLTSIFFMCENLETRPLTSKGLFGENVFDCNQCFLDEGIYLYFYFN